MINNLIAALLVSYCPGNVVEHQAVNNVVVQHKFYVPVELSDGYKTELPVVNGLLPEVEQHYIDGKIQLNLDYSKGIVYKPTNTRIKYVKVQPIVELKPLKRDFTEIVAKIEPSKVIKTESDEDLDLILKNMTLPNQIEPSRVIVPSYKD